MKRDDIIRKYPDLSTKEALKKHKDQIEHIEKNVAEYSDESNYCLVITYSDGYVTNRSDSIYLPRPKSTVWYRGASDPLTTLGKVGDFYLNITNGNVYYKVDSATWEYQFSMKGESTSVTSEYSTVLFDPNGGTFSDSSTMAFASTIKGTPIDLSDIPTPTYEDHTFLG